jgi:hypothetical protein
MFWRGASEDRLFWATFDANSGDWGPQSSLPLRSRTGPALALLNGRLYMAWIDPANSPNISWATYDEHANSWILRSVLTDRGSHDGPALITFGQRLYMIWRGIVGDETDQHLYRSVYDEASGQWSPQEQMTPPQPPAKPPPQQAVGWLASRVRPALARFQASLYMACVGDITSGPAGGQPDDPTDNTPGGETFPPDLRVFYTVSSGTNIVPYPVPNWMALAQDNAGHDFLSGGWPALAVYAYAPGSLRNFLTTRSFDPSKGVREFAREFWPEASSLRTLMSS